MKRRNLPIDFQLGTRKIIRKITKSHKDEEIFVLK